MRYTKGEKTFSVVNAILLSVLALCMLLPFMHVIAQSLSEDKYVVSGSVGVWPKGFSTLAYQYAFNDTPILRAFRNTVFITLAGTVLALFVETTTAYPLSIRSLRGRRGFMYYYVFTMLFSAGLIPGFLLMRSLGLLNNLWSMILPHLLNAFNLVLIKNYFEGLPESISESAMIDGANHIQVLFRIMLPMALPILATVALFTAVEFWNSYFNAMLYLSDPKKMTLQLFLVNLVKQANTTDSITSDIIVAPDTVRSASVIIGLVPILMVYPFVQRYFVTGITLGAVKG